MKTKEFRKKLNLNKKTIADLGGNEMPHIKGGQALPTQTCVTCLGVCPTRNYNSCITWACPWVGSCPCDRGCEDQL